MSSSLLGGHAGVADVGRDYIEDGRREGQVEEAVGCGPFLPLGHLLVQELKVPPGVVAPRHVAIRRPKGLVPLHFIRFDLCACPFTDSIQLVFFFFFKELYGLVSVLTFIWASHLALNSSTVMCDRA